MEIYEVMEDLEVAGKFSDLYHVTQFVGFRERSDGVMREVRVEIWDSGPHRGDTRYMVVATDEDGRSATGNPASTIETTMRIVHWHDLDGK